MDFKIEDVAELAQAEPLHTLVIHGRTFRVGTLTPDQFEDIDIHERRLAQARLRGEALHADERDPTHILVHLLWSGSRHPVYRDLLPYVKHDHLVAAHREATRQRLVASLYA
jgi:hypothetical protein